MPAHKASPIELSVERELNALVRTHSTPQKLAERARIMLLAASGLGVEETADELGIWRKTASTWRRRWTEAEATAGVAARLSDTPRSGAPARFTPEVICKIVALSHEDPEALDVPISHWSQSELARQAVRRGIVESISHGSVGRTLHGYLQRWHYDGTLATIHHALYMECREQIGREVCPTACVIDSQSVKSAENGGPASIRMVTTLARRSRERSGISSLIW